MINYCVGLPIYSVNGGAGFPVAAALAVVAVAAVAVARVQNKIPAHTAPQRTGPEHRNDAYMAVVPEQGQKQRRRGKTLGDSVET